MDVIYRAIIYSIVCNCFMKGIVLILLLNLRKSSVYTRLAKGRRFVNADCESIFTKSEASKAEHENEMKLFN